MIAVALAILTRLARPDATTRAVATATTRTADGPFARILFGLTLGLVCLTWLAMALESVRRPALQGDEAMHWGMRAQAMFQAAGFGERLLAWHHNPLYPPHSDYPLWNPLNRLAASQLLGEFSFVYGRLPIQLVYAGLILLMASALRRVGGRLFAAAGLLACFMHPTALATSFSAFSEPQLAFGLLLALDGAMRFADSGERASARLIPIGLALALFAKNEGLLFCFALVVALAPTLFSKSGRAAARRLAQNAGAAALWPLIALALWFGFNAWHGFANDLVTGKGEDIGLYQRLVAHGLERAPVILDYFVRDILTAPAASGWIFLVWFAALAVGARHGLAFAGVHAAVLVAFGGLIFVYLTTPQELVWHLESSAARVVWPLAPSTLLLSALALRARPERADPNLG